jgi:hypothetical protein
MNRNTLRLGYFSAWGIIILTILLISGFFLQFVIVPEREWVPCKTSYYTIDTSISFLSDFCGVVYFLQTPLILVLFTCFHDYASGSLKIFSGISLSLIISFTALRILNYIVALTIRSINIHACDDDCLIYYIHSIFQSSISAIDVMTMTVFLAMAELFIIPVFSKADKIEKKIRVIMLMAGIVNLISALVFIFNIYGLSALSILISYLFFNSVLFLLLKFFRQFKSQKVDFVNK